MKSFLAIVLTLSLAGQTYAGCGWGKCYVRPQVTQVHRTYPYTDNRAYDYDQSRETTTFTWNNYRTWNVSNAAAGQTLPGLSDYGRSEPDAYRDILLDAMEVEKLQASRKSNVVDVADRMHAREVKAREYNDYLRALQAVPRPGETGSSSMTVNNDYSQTYEGGGGKVSSDSSLTPQQQLLVAAVDKYCFKCHNNQKKSGDLSLEDLSALSDGMIQKVLTAVTGGGEVNGHAVPAMPPKGEDQPAWTERKAFLDYWGK